MAILKSTRQKLPKLRFVIALSLFLLDPSPCIILSLRQAEGPAITKDDHLRVLFLILEEVIQAGLAKSQQGSVHSYLASAISLRKHFEDVLLQIPELLDMLD